LTGEGLLAAAPACCVIRSDGSDAAGAGFGGAPLAFGAGNALPQSWGTSGGSFNLAAK
jgi:hypothetical protein